MMSCITTLRVDFMRYQKLDIFKIQCQLVVPQNFLLNSSKLVTAISLTLTAFYFISLSLF